MMKSESVKAEHVTPADGNIFLDLGFPPEEAAVLLKESREKIEVELRKHQAVNERRKSENPLCGACQ